MMLILAVVGLAIAAITIFILYKTALSEERARLVDTAQSQARLMEAVARYDRQQHPENQRNAATEATLLQIREAHKRLTGFGETGEIVLAKREGERIIFLLTRRRVDMETPSPIPFDSKLAVPMRFALEGKSGAMKSWDYRGKTVLAAYEPVAELNLGIVAKIDMSEIRSPFIRAGLLALLVTMAFVGIGAWLFQRASDPLLRRIQRSEENLKEAQVIAGMGSWEWDIRHGKVFWSDQLYSIFGLQAEKLEPSFKLFMECVYPDDRAEVRRLIARSIRMLLPFSVDFRIVRPDGQLRWVHGQGEEHSKSKKGSQLWCGTVQDITERKRIEDQVRQKAYFDPLTGLPNRSLYYDRLRQAITQSSRNQSSMAVMFMDLDFFKPINDELGHEYGDQALIEVGKRLQQCVRGADTVARIGGDEFSIILGEISSESAACLVAEKIIGAIKEPMMLSNAQYTLGISIGIYIATPDQDDAESIMRLADDAMYQAKASGRNRYCLYQATGQDLPTELNEALRLERALRQALAHDEFRIHYQPKVRLIDGRITGMHALVRWHSPDSGLLMPDTFLPLAIRTGLIVPIGEWVLQQACRQNAAWQSDGLPIVPVSVNITVDQLRRSDFVPMVLHTLETTGLAAAMLELEIGEAELMQHGPACLEALNQLNSSGIKITVDNFGTGLFSLQTLRSLPIHELKMNRSLISLLGKGDDKKSIANAIIAMGHILNHQVVAEGVETQDQLDFLRRHESDGMLGYLTSPPMPAEAVAEQLKSQRLNLDTNP